jgi:hypothetical protein
VYKVTSCKPLLTGRAWGDAREGGARGGA